MKHAFIIWTFASVILTAIESMNLVVFIKGDYEFDINEAEGNILTMIININLLIIYSSLD